MCIRSVRDIANVTSARSETALSCHQRCQRQCSSDIGAVGDGAKLYLQRQNVVGFRPVSDSADTDLALSPIALVNPNQNGLFEKRPRKL
jgi:hypothetical protein